MAHLKQNKTNCNERRLIDVVTFAKSFRPGIKCPEERIVNNLNEHSLVVLMHTKICLKVKHDLESLLNFIL